MPTTITPNMSLIKPTVLSEPGPDYATDVNSSTDLIDAHDHTTGKGVRVPVAGFNFNADLPAGSFNIYQLRATKFDNQSGALTQPTDLRMLYVRGGELYFVDNAGNQVKITNAGAVNVSGSNGIGGDYGGGNPASLTFTEATSTYTFLENTSGPSYASIDYQGSTNRGAIIQTSTAVSSSPYTVLSTDTVLLVDTSSARTINLPNAATAKRILMIKDSTGSSATNAITLDRSAGGNIDGVASNKTLQKAYGQWYLISDGTNWFVLKEDARDLTSYTSFNAPASGTDTLTVNAWTAFPLTNTSTTFTEGLAVSRSTNDLTFPAVGKYEIEIYIPNWAISGNTLGQGLRFRNTTDGTTAAVGEFIDGAVSGSGYGRYFYDHMEVDVTNIAKVYQLQYYAQAGGGSPSSSFGVLTAVSGETSPRWRVKIRKLKNT